jgi:NADH-quinone oxidoreductase subunit H
MIGQNFFFFSFGSFYDFSEGGRFWDVCALIAQILGVFICLLLAVAYFTLAERKLLAVTQRRRGPNVIGVYGLLQPLSDGLKLFLKESIFPSSADKYLFVLAPLITFLTSLIGWAVIPYSLRAYILELDFSILYILACSALGIYGIVIAGWSSNSKYAFLGAMRSTAQMISYEVSIGLIICTLVLYSGSFNINTLIFFQAESGWFFYYFPILFLIFCLAGVAETNRHPFDLPEAEAELVSGYNVEYAAMGFALFSLGEYANILMMSSMMTILFFGGWLAPVFGVALGGSVWYGIKICFFVVLFVLLRAGLPRYRYDQLMKIGWEICLLAVFANYFFLYTTLWVFNGLPF